MAANPDFEWNDWSDFLNDGAFGDQADGLGMQAISGL